MRGPIQRIISVACAMLMIITVFHAMVRVAHAASVEKPAGTEVLDHSHMRLTISNIKATLPTMIAAAGILHISWADATPCGSRLAYKSSEDGGQTFSADRVVSPTFLSIFNTSIAASDDGASVAIVAEVNRNDDSSREICCALSEDGGVTWNPVIFISKGHGPTVAFCGNKVVVGFTSIEKETAYVGICAALALPAASTSNDILGWASLFFGLISIGAGAVSAFAGYSTFEKGAGWAAVIIGGISLVIGLGPVWYHG
jgi:hypothetical protein